jgi:hypothetical protein
MRLGHLCHIQVGYTARSRLDPAERDGRLFVQLRDVAVDGGIDPSRLTRCDLSDLPDRYLAHPGDVLFRSRGDHTTATALGDDLPEPAAVIFPLVILRRTTDRLDPRYLAWAINQPRAQRHLDAGAQGQSLRMISRGCLEALEIDLPDLATQRAVVAVDALSRDEARLATRLADLRHRKVSTLLADAARRHALEPA